MFEETILYQHKASFPHLTVISGHDLHSFQLNGEQTFGRISRRGRGLPLYRHRKHERNTLLRLDAHRRGRESAFRR